MNISTMDASVGVRRAMTSQQSVFLRNIRFPQVISTGTPQTLGVDSTPRHFVRLDGIGGRVVLAPHPEEDPKMVILDIDRVEYPA